jgi:hypothetical protein
MPSSNLMIKFVSKLYINTIYQERGTVDNFNLRVDLK